MLENLLNLRRRFAIARHREAPLLRERERFLEYLHSQGTSLAALRGVSWQLLNVITLLKLTPCAASRLERSRTRDEHGKYSSGRIQVLLRSLSEQRSRARWSYRGEKFRLGSDAEQLRYEARLSADIIFGYPPHSSLPDHVHRLDSFKCSHRTLKRTVALG